MQRGGPRPERLLLTRPRQRSRPWPRPRPQPGRAGARRCRVRTSPSPAPQAWVAGVEWQSRGPGTVEPVAWRWEDKAA
ncbi:unnamed protein product [Caretta caretta]